MDKHVTDVAGGALFLVFGIVLLLYIIPTHVVQEDPLYALGPETFPNIIAWAMIILGGILCASGAMSLRKSGAAGEGSAPGMPGLRREMWAVVSFGIMALYAWLLTVMPFLAATPLAACLMLAVLRVRKWYFYVTVCLFSGLIHTLFARFMQVQLP